MKLVLPGIVNESNAKRPDMDVEFYFFLNAMINAS
jgi:hypothetical protein